MTITAGTVTHVGEEGITVLAGGVDAAHTVGPMETLISGLVEGSRVAIATRDDVPGTWAVIGEFAQAGGPATVPRSSTIDVRWRVRKKVSDTLTLRWAVAAPSSHAVSDTFTLRWAVKRRIAATMDVRWRVLGNATNLGFDIRAYMRQPGGQVLLLAPGNYYAGVIGRLAGSAYEHPQNGALPFNGKLRIGAQIPGTVNVYLDPTGGGRFNITDMQNGGGLGWNDYYSDDGYGELGICFEDLNFVNGSTVFTGTSGIDFINCTWTNPAALWKQTFDTICQIRHVPVVAQIPNNDQYRAIFDDALWKRAGGGGLRLQRLATYNPWLGQNVPHGGSPCTRIRNIAGDHHDCYDDPLFWGGTVHAKNRGYRCWNIGEDTYHGEGPRAWIHPDASQYIGQEDDIDEEGLEEHAHLEIVAETPGNITRLRYVKVRQLNNNLGSVAAFQFRNLSGIIDFFQWGANNITNDGDYAFNATHPWYPFPDTSDYVPISLQYTWPPDGVHMKYLTKTDLANLGYTMGGNQGRGLANPLQAINDPGNFANQWRTANPTGTDAQKVATIASLGGWAWNPV
jgi:hypothetical protein